MKLMEFFYFDDKKMDYANDERYSNDRDINVVEKNDTRKLRLTLRQINQLRKNSEAHEFEKAARGRDFSIIFLASPTSTPKRLKLIARHSKGFIYYVSLTGVTGARDYLPSHITTNIKKIKRITDKPVCVGFGISRPRQAGRIARVADGVIIGSAMINIISINLEKGAYLKKLARYASSLSKAIKGV